jgi:hypothetical protein
VVWTCFFHPAFRSEFDELPLEVQDELLAVLGLLAQFGPSLKRPHADTLEGSRHANMKELRFEAADGEWRAAYAFDPERRGIVLVAGDKSGTASKLFYRRLISKADKRFDQHLSDLEPRRRT